MEDGGADSDEAGGDEQPVEGGRDGEQEKAAERGGHPGSQRIGFRVLVSELADDGLQERGYDLVGESEETEVGEVEVEAALEDGVDGGQQRLHHVVEEVAEADGDQYAKEALRGLSDGLAGGDDGSG